MEHLNEKDYKNLNVWKDSRKLVLMVYELSSKFPSEEKFGLTSQIRRCAISIPSNLAEGFGRNSRKETKQFVYIAKGSVYELETQLCLAEDLKFATSQQINQVQGQLVVVRKLIIGYLKYLEKIASAQHSKHNTQN